MLMFYTPVFSYDAPIEHSNECASIYSLNTDMCLDSLVDMLKDWSTMAMEWMPLKGLKCVWTLSPCFLLLMNANRCGEDRSQR